MIWHEYEDELWDLPGPLMMKYNPCCHAFTLSDTALVTYIEWISSLEYM